MSGNANPSWKSVPADLPQPKDDGSCDHLKTGNYSLPAVSLQSTSQNTVDVSSLAGTTVLFCYPRTGAPNETVPDEWNEIPGARGCTPQACSFRDAAKEFSRLGVSRVFGLSTQDTAYQLEVKERIHLPYDLLSDRDLELTSAMRLPTFEFRGETLTKRMAWVIEDGKIVKCFYPVFPPDKSAEQVMTWLRERNQQ